MYLIWEQGGRYPTEGETTTTQHHSCFGHSYFPALCEHNEAFNKFLGNRGLEDDQMVIKICISKYLTSPKSFHFICLEK